MLFNNAKLALLFIRSATVLAETFNVDVGGNNALVFNPTSIKANPGDIVRFKFLDLNHTVTAGKAEQGCQPNGQFNSGFVPIAKNTNPGTTFDVTVRDTNPITVYCAQLQHCQKGMVMVINPGEGPTSLSAYKKVCSQAAKNVAPSRVNGGVLRNVQKGNGKKDGGKDQNEEARKQQEEARKQQEEAQRRQQEEQKKQQEEERKRQEEAQKQREEEEKRRQEEQKQREEEQKRKQEEEQKQREEEQKKKQEEEQKQREEEQKKKQEEEQKQREEEQKRKEEEEKKKQEQEQAQKQRQNRSLRRVRY